MSDVISKSAMKRIATLDPQKAADELMKLRKALFAFVEHFGPIEDNHMLNDGARNCFRLAREALVTSAATVEPPFTFDRETGLMGFEKPWNVPYIRRDDNPPAPTVTVSDCPNCAGMKEVVRCHTETIAKLLRTAAPDITAVRDGEKED